MKPREDYALERLIDLDGEVLVISEDGRYWVKIEARRVPRSPGRPHGVAYSLTLHGSGNERLVGYDNAHPVHPLRWDDPHDHQHVRGTAKPYRYRNAAELLESFWSSVTGILREDGLL